MAAGIPPGISILLSQQSIPKFRRRPSRARPFLWFWNECKKDRSGGKLRYIDLQPKGKTEISVNISSNLR